MQIGGQGWQIQIGGLGQQIQIRGQGWTSRPGAKQRAGGWEIQIPLRHKFLRSQSIEDRKAYNKQRNYGISLIRKIKNDYYN